MAQAAENLALYHFDSCPFCLRVRLALRKMGLEIELRDIHKDRSHYDDLVRFGGSRQVPCLRIAEGDGTDRWLYESADIIDYLNSEVAASG